MTDVFALQDEIGQAIAEALRVRLVPRARVRNLEAWEHWLKGVHYRGRNTPDGVAKAKEHFEQASILDPAYAQAYSGLAFCYFVLASQGAGPVGDLTQLAIQAAEKALALDPSDSDAHTLLGVMASVFNYQWKQAETHFLRALACEQVSPRARYCYAAYSLLPAGKIDEAIASSRLALQEDPLFMLYHYGVVWCLCAAGRHQEAIAHARRALEIDPNAHLVLIAIGFAQLRAGLPDEAVVSFRRVAELAPWTHVGAGCLAAAYWAAGDEASGRDVARRFTDADRLGFGGAIYYATAGDADAMFEALDASYERRDIFMPNLPLLSAFDPYRADPRFALLLGRLGL
jgi:serine/threonine-protein kinase